MAELHKPATEFQRRADEAFQSAQETAAAFAKLKRIILGDTDDPTQGHAQRIARLEKSLEGDGTKDLGIRWKVQVMWYAFLMAIALLGYAVHPLIGKVVALIKP